MVGLAMDRKHSAISHGAGRRRMSQKVFRFAPRRRMANCISGHAYSALLNADLARAAGGGCCCASKISTTRRVAVRI